MIGILWLLSTLSITGSLEVHTVAKYLATCGENLTLSCDVVADNALEIKRFYWMEKQDICDFGEDTDRTDFRCNGTSSKATPMIYKFSLSISDVQPRHEGTYHCKLRAKEGVKNNKTVLRVQKCVGDSTSGKTAEEATCTFKDVYPASSVQWSRGGENLTHLATTEVKKNAEGKFTVISSVKLQTEPSDSDDYDCSLVMPVENERNQTVAQTLKSLKNSGGRMATAQRLILAIVFGTLLV